MIDDTVLQEPQFYPAIYVLVSKLLDKFGNLVYDRLYNLNISTDGAQHHESAQYQHNFVPQSNSDEDGQQQQQYNKRKRGSSSEASDDNDKGWTTMFSKKNKEKVSDASSDGDRNVYGNDNNNDYDDEKHQQFIQMQKSQKGGNNMEDALPINFRASHCSNLCQTKCGNWFFKISAIRELVPRILIEISLYRTLRFLYPIPELLEYTKLLVQRLRGISNPLIAAYVRIFALEQIFGTFGTNSFIYDDENGKKSNNNNESNGNGKKKDNKFDFDMIEDIYLMVLNDILFIFKSMYDSNFKDINCVFYGQMASEDYLNLFNPIFDLIFDILKYNKVIKNVNDMKLYLDNKINPDLLKLIDLNSFLGIKDSDPYILNLDNTNNIYNQNNDDDTKKKRRKKRQAPIVPFDENINNDNNNNGDALSEMAQNFQNTDTSANQ